MSSNAGVSISSLSKVYIFHDLILKTAENITFKIKLEKKLTLSITKMSNTIAASIYKFTVK